VRGIKLLILFLIPLMMTAQDSDMSGLSNQMIKKYYKSALRSGDEYSQIDYLSELINRKPDDVKWRFALARAYDEARDYQKALDNYSKAYYADKTSYSVALFHMGRIMKTRRQYDFASLYFKKFIDEYSGKNDGRYYKKLVKNEIAGCDFAKYGDTLGITTEVTHLAGGINWANIEFSPVIIDSNKFWYVCLPSDEVLFHGGDPEHDTIPKRRIHEALKGKRGGWYSHGEADLSVNMDDENIGSFALSPDGLRMYFTRCKPNWKYQMQCKLFVMKKDESGNWGSPEELPGEINHKGSTSTQPAVGSSSKPDRDILYFVSNRSGGKGGLDIWYTRYRISKDRYEKPRNCGTKINTVTDDITPRFDEYTHRLYFSSQGWPSVGGYDVHYATGERSKWMSKAKNAGLHINSPLDDLYYTVFDDRDLALVVSNRDESIALKHAHCCDDLFMLKVTDRIRLTEKGLVINEETNKPEKDVRVSLIILDKENGEEFVAARTRTDDQGRFELDLDPDMEYRIRIKKDQFFADEYERSTMGKKDNETNEVRMTIKPVTNDEISIPNIYYEFNSAELTVDAKTAIDTSILRILTENPEIIVELGSHTDSKGSHAYNEHLSQQRAESVVSYLRSKGVKSQRLSAKGYGENQPVAPNENADGSDNPEGRAKNRRTTFRVIGELPVDIIYEDD
jgi:OOP family OmpA-OmpF porin